MVEYTQSFSPYLIFSRKEWANLRKSAPLTLNNEELLNIKSTHENISLNEVIGIYLPLSRLLNFYIQSNLCRCQTILKQFIGTDSEQRVPYIIGVAGSVAVGKSTTARLLKILLSRWPEHRIVELVTTDGFLHSNSILKQRNLMGKKGFPQSYDINSLINFLSKVKSGVSKIAIPIYSHLLYDILPNKKKIISKPDILILEGLNVLQQSSNYYKYNPHRAFISDFIDFSIYVDAPEKLLKQWYIERFLHFCKNSFLDKKSYFHHYAYLPKDKAISVASQIWREINGLNLHKNILPTRERAILILKKSTNHMIYEIKLRK